MSTTAKTLAAALFASFALAIFVSSGPWKTPDEVSFGILGAIGLGAGPAGTPRHAHAAPAGDRALPDSAGAEPAQR